MARLDIALKKVLGWEGGFANDPDDTGGATMKGVTIGTYKTYCKMMGKPVPTVADLKKITNAEIYDLADKLFWSKIKGDLINNQSIANLCFDCVWGSGTGYIKVIQKILKVQADGIFGQISLNALNQWTPQKDLFDKLWNRRKQYLEGCSTAWKYLNGWMRRLRSYTFSEEPAPVSTEPVHNVVDHSEVNSTDTCHKTEPIVFPEEPIETGTSEEPQTVDTQEAAEEKKRFLDIIIDFIKKLFHIE